MPPIRSLDDAFLSQLLEEDIDINDVVLNSNIDSTSLSSVLKKLEATSNALQQEIFNKVDKNFDEFSSLYNDSQSIHWKVLDLVENVSSTEKEVHNDSKEVHSTIENYKNTVFESEKNQAKITTLEIIEQSLQRLDDIKNSLKQSDYLKVVKDLSQLSKSLENWTEGDNRITGMITEQLLQTKQSLITHLQDDVSTAIQFNVGSVRILETFQPSPDTKATVHISTVFQCLHQLKILPEELMRVERLIFRNILHPYFENVSSTLQMDEVQLGPSSKGGVLQVIKLDVGANDDIRFTDPVEMTQQIDSIIGFFHRYIFSAEKDKDKEIKQLFGNLLSPELFELMINKSIAQAVPSSKEHLAEFERVTETVNIFENRCRDVYGFQLDSDEINTLGTYVSNIDKHYAKKRCEKILQQGRKVMVRRLYDTDTAHVTEIDGHTYRYQITQTPQILLVLISDTLTEAADLLDSHPISASTLIKGIQDLLDMYRAIMPSFHRSQYLSSAASSLVFRNDCLWLANQLSTDIVKRAEVQRFTNCDHHLEEASRRLAELGKAWHELAMTQCLQMVQRVLEPLEGFSGISENEKFQQDCEHATGQVIEIIKSFASNTRPVVDETLFLDILGRIVDKLLIGLITDIEGLVDIGAEESHVIARNLNSLAQLVGVFDLPEKDASEAFVSDLVPNWEKFWLVKDILEMNMREIMEFHRLGKLHMFEKSELVGLLCSLFADTDLREANIEEIKSGRIVQDTVERSMSHTTNSLYNTTTMISPTATTPAATPTTTSNAVVSTPATTANNLGGLNYQLDDDDMEEMDNGWGDNEDDDLFADNTLTGSFEHEPPINHPELSSSIKTNNPVNHDLKYIPDEDMEDMDNGWGDSEDDLFGDDALVEPSEDTTAKHVDEPSLPKTSASPVTLDLKYIPEGDMEEEIGEGWGDDDDIFGENN